VVRLALALFGDELSPRFCFARVVAIVEWDGAIARSVGQVLLGRTPYPARLEILAEHSVTRLLCGSFPRERLVDAARFGIAVHCGVSGGVPEADDDLSAFIVGLGLQLDAVDGSTLVVATSKLCGGAH
jgi:hypothetical protein